MENKHSLRTPVSLLELNTVDMRRREQEMWAMMQKTHEEVSGDSVDLSERETYVISGIEAIEEMRELTMDGTPVARAAETFVRIMNEFAADDEPFQPSIDAELRQFLEVIIVREHPDLSDDDRVWLFDQLRDFPPVR
ncbi:MAG: hypothetical protein WBP22_00815 [Candidatus Saccharimonas sp.]